MMVDVIEQLESLRRGYELEREMAKEGGYPEDARYFHGKVVAIQSAIDVIRRAQHADIEHGGET